MNRPNFLPLLLNISICVVAMAFCSQSLAQTSLSEKGELTDDIRDRLSARISLELRDATLLDALFAVRDASGLNIVVGNEVTGTVNASFVDSPVHDILDSLLITRGYGYRAVGGSLAIVPLVDLGDQLPLFETQVIGLNHMAPSDILPSIESMLSPEGRVHGIASSNSVVIVDYPGRITKIRSHVDTLELATEQYQHGTQASQQPMSTPMAGRDDDGIGGTVVRIFQPQYVSASVLSEAIIPLLSPDGQVAPVELEDKLVVTDTSECLDRIASALAQLDVPRPQVRIWALIYDCSIDDLEQIGVNWGSGIHGSGVDVNGDPLNYAVLNTVTSAVTGSANGVLTLASVSDHFNLSSVVQALKSADDSRLLADPNVVVMNHEPAEIAIVTEVPYQQLTQGIEGGTIGTTEFREAGVTLNVTPHIAQDQTVALVVNPQFSLLTGFSEPDNAPIIDRRETVTTVRVANNQTIVLGGLRQRTRITDRRAIPLLGRIPYFGCLFRYRSANTRESELLIFITPQIVMPDHLGSPREACMATTLQSQINQTPTTPLPFGMPVVRAEQKAYVHGLNQHSACLSGNCGMIHSSNCNHNQCRSGNCSGQCSSMIETPTISAPVMIQEVETGALPSSVEQMPAPIGGADSLPLSPVHVRQLNP